MGAADEGADRGVSRRRAGPRALRAGSPDLARSVGVEPWRHNGPRHQGHHRAGCDPMRGTADTGVRGHEARGTSLVNIHDISAIEVLILRRLLEVTLGNHRSRSHGPG